LGHWKHGADERHRQAGFFEFFADHSAAATARPSRGDEDNSLDVVLF
jgi:hypothetical protein